MAGVDVGTAYLTVVPSAKGFAGKLQSELGGGMAAAGSKAGASASKSFGSTFKSGISTAAKAGALALAGIAAGGIAFVKSSISEARESQKVGALTANVIKSTGGAAKISAAQVGDLATAISNKTGIDDEAIQSGANMLLTFKNIRNEAGKGNDIFNQSTSILTDLATAMGSDPQKAAIQLGKALNDPIKGVAALGRVGVTFDAQQKKTIKSLVDGGKTAEAQKIILKELNSEFGGAAEASATAGEKMSTAFGNFKEGVGTSLLPVLDKTEGFLTNRLLPGIQGVIDILFKGDFTSGFAKAFNISEDSKIVDFLFNVREGAQQLFNILFKGNYTDGPLSGPMLTNLLKLRDGFFAVKDAATQFVTEFKNGEGAGGRFRDTLNTLVTVITAVVSAGVTLVRWLNDHRTTTIAAVAAVAALVAITRIHAAVMAVQAAGGLLKMIQSTKVITGLTRAYAAVQWLMNAALTANPIGIVVVALVALVAGLVIAYKKSETFRAIVKGAFEAISAAATFMWNKVVAPVIRFLIGAFVSVTQFYATLLNGLSKIPGFGWAKGAADKLQNVANKAAGIRDNIKDIPDHKNVTVSVGFVQTGRITLPGGSKVNVGQRASGGPVSANSPYWVGENPDGSLNKTSELFVPNSAGTIYNQSQLAGMGGGKTDLSESSLQRLAAILSGVSTRAVIGQGDLERGIMSGVRG